jgi:hypothetical protein
MLIYCGIDLAVHNATMEEQLKIQSTSDELTSAAPLPENHQRLHRKKKLSLKSTPNNGCIQKH